MIQNVVLLRRYSEVYRKMAVKSIKNYSGLDYSYCHAVARVEAAGHVSCITPAGGEASGVAGAIDGAVVSGQHLRRDRLRRGADHTNILDCVCSAAAQAGQVRGTRGARRVTGGECRPF